MWRGCDQGEWAGVSSRQRRQVKGEGKHERYARDTGEGGRGWEWERGKRSGSGDTGGGAEKGIWQAEQTREVGRALGRGEGSGRGEESGKWEGKGGVGSGSERG